MRRLPPHEILSPILLHCKVVQKVMAPLVLPHDTKKMEIPPELYNDRTLNPLNMQVGMLTIILLALVVQNNLPTPNPNVAAQLGQLVCMVL